MTDAERRAAIIVDLVESGVPASHAALLYRGGPAGRNDPGALWVALAGVIGSD